MRPFDPSVYDGSYPSLTGIVNPTVCFFWNHAHNSMNGARFVLCKEAKHGGIDS